MPHFNALAGSIPNNIAINDTSLKLDFLACISVAESIGKTNIFNHFYVIRPESYRIRCGHPRSSKVTGFGTKLICDCLLAINTNVSPILHRFRDMAFDRSKIAIFSYPFVYPTEGFPWYDLRKIYLDVNRWPTYQMA